MKCINEKCSRNNLKGKCQSVRVFNCESRINPTHTPNYAEEQLEHARDKENKCYNKEYQHIKNNQCYLLKTNSCSAVIKEPINYEEEYNKLKKENERLKRLNDEYSIEIIKLESEISNVIKERDNYKEITESQNKRIEELEEQSKLKDEIIVNLNKTIQNKNNIIEITKNKAKEWFNKYEELKKQNNQGYMEQMNLTLNEKNDEIEDLKEKLHLAKREENETEWLKDTLTRYEIELKQDRENISALKTLINLL